jgi:hypothetical protein
LHFKDVGYYQQAKVKEVKMITVKATREGLVGHSTATGWVIDTITMFVALPSHKALGKNVRIVNPANGKECIAEVKDIGPWNTHDNNYVFGGARPLSESGISVSGNGTNDAGIDLGEAVWMALEMRDNSDVSWEFV